MSKREDNKTTVPFPTSTTHVHPNVDPAALRYAQEMQKRRYQAPVAGGPGPSIPRLDMPHRDDMTMADQARFSGAPPSQSGWAPSQLNNPGMHRTQPSGILPTDILPESAKQDPQFQGGMGSMAASSQPHLAQKYGVIRNGQFIPAQQLQTGRPGLSKGSLEGLQMLQNLQKSAETPPPPQEDNASSSAGAAARLANGPGDDDTKPLSEEDKSKLKRAMENMDDFDFNTFREMMMKDLLNNEEQRKAIESRLEPLDLTDLIMTGRVTQRVPIVPGKYEPVFQSISGEEDLAIKRIVWQEQKSIQAPNQYMLDKYSLMGVALGLHSINGSLLPSHLDNNGDFKENLFMEKFNKVIKFPWHLLSSLGINFFWFDVRVRKLFQADAIKNG